MLNCFIYNGNETTGPCAKCGEDAKIRHGRTIDTGSPIHDIDCPNCGRDVVYVGYYCLHCQKSPSEKVFIDSQGRAWHILEHEDKSISVYYTTQDNPTHNVVYDSLDDEKLDKLIRTDEQLLEQLRYLASSSRKRK